MALGWGLYFRYQVNNLGKNKGTIRENLRTSSVQPKVTGPYKKGIRIIDQKRQLVEI